MSHLPLFAKPKRAPKAPLEPTAKKKAKRAPPKAATEQVTHPERRRASSPVQGDHPLVQPIRHYAPLIVVGILALVVVTAILRSAASPNQLATTFTPEVQHWARQILDWAARYGIDPNLIAAIMQIESCGNPGAASGAGAQGLFQVMPLNFSPEVTNQLDPDANAKAGLGVIKDCLRYANNDVGLALACYNGGPSVINQPPSSWPAETKRYVAWGVGIYNDALRRAQRSDSLDNWLASGGIGLCQSAAASLGLSTRSPNISTFAPPPTTLPTFASGAPIIPPTVTPETFPPPQTAAP